MPNPVSPLRAQAQQVNKLVDKYQQKLETLSGAKGPEVTLGLAADPRGADVSALVMTVMMQAAKAAQKDLKAVMTQMRSVKEARQALRQAVEPGGRTVSPDFDATFQLIATLYGNQLNGEVQAMTDNLDSASERGEMESLRLQMAMDRMSKLMSTLSNLLKKMADTQSQIVQNLK